MLSLILIVLIIVSFTNPKVMVKKEILEKATPEEATKLVKTNRRSFIIIVLMLEAVGMMNKYFYVGLIFMAVAIGLAVGFKVFSASKGNRNLVAEIQARESRPEEIEFAENQTYEIPSNDTQTDENNMQ